MDIDGLKDRDTIIINKELYYKEPLKDNIASLFYDEGNQIVTIGMYYKYNKNLKKHMGYSLTTGSFFFTKDFSLKATDSEDYDTINESIGSSDRFYHYLKRFYEIKTHEALEDQDKESFLKYSKLYINLKKETECIK